MQTGELLGSGRSADVFALDDHCVLRRYRDGGDVTAEAAAMAYLTECRYPVPRLRGPAGAGHSTAPRTDLVMQRLHGPSMLQVLLQGMITAEEAGAWLANLLHRLHSVPARVSVDPGNRVLQSTTSWTKTSPTAACALCATRGPAVSTRTTLLPQGPEIPPFSAEPGRAPRPASSRP
ncbi:phosphotransferase [Streptomyces sp. NPDC003015]